MGIIYKKYSNRKDGRFRENLDFFNVLKIFRKEKIIALRKKYKSYWYIIMLPTNLPIRELCILDMRTRKKTDFQSLCEDDYHAHDWITLPINEKYLKCKGGKMCLSFRLLSDKEWEVSQITSSKEYSKKISKLLDMKGHNECNRIKDYFNIKNSIKLSKGFIK